MSEAAIIQCMKELKQCRRDLEVDRVVFIRGEMSQKVYQLSVTKTVEAERHLNKTISKYLEILDHSAP